MLKIQDLGNVVMDDAFQKAIVDPSVGGRGVGGAIPVNGKVTFNGFTFIPNNSVITELEYANLSATTKARCTRNDDGTYTRDQSYFAVTTDGAAERVTFSSLQSFRRYEHLLDLTKDVAKGYPQELRDEIETFNAAVKASDVYAISPKSAQGVAKEISGDVRAKKSVMLLAQVRIPEGVTINFSPSSEARPAANSIRIDLWGNPKAGNGKKK